MATPNPMYQPPMLNTRRVASQPNLYADASSPEFINALHGPGRNNENYFNPQMQETQSERHLRDMYKGGFANPMAYTGPSRMAQFANRELQRSGQHRMAEARRMGQSGLSQGMDALATRGGLSGGAAERMAMQSGRDTSRAYQGIGRDMDDRMDKASRFDADYQARQNQFLRGQQQQALGTVFGSERDALNQQRQFRQGLYKDWMDKMFKTKMANQRHQELLDMKSQGFF